MEVEHGAVALALIQLQLLQESGHPARMVRLSRRGLLLLLLQGVLPAGALL